MEILCYLAGTIFFYTKSVYSLIFVCLCLFFKANWKIIIWFALAWAMAFIHQIIIADQGMPESKVIQKAEIEGSVTSIPIDKTTKTQFEFALDNFNGKPAQAAILLSCYQKCPVFRIGQRWRFMVKLKQPENLGNPGHFDYQGLLASRHIQWTGYLKNGKYWQLPASDSTFNLLAIRNKLAGSLTGGFSSKEALGITQALTLGITTNLGQKQWDLFRRTGTTHLMVISGSHIVLVAGLLYWLVYWLWSRSSRLCLYKPSAQAAALIAVLAAIAYALIAGFAVPTQRSLIACLIVSVRHFVSRRYTGWQAWRYGLLIILLTEPHAVLSAGFYLSFLAVAILFAISQRLDCGTVKKAIGIQAACLFGLMPFTLYWFSYGALNGFFANLVAIPLVGYIIVPFALFGLLVNQIVTLPVVLLPVDYAIKWLMIFLQWIDQYEKLNFNYPVTTVFLLFALMTAMAVLCFLPLRAFILPALITLGAAAMPAKLSIRPGEARVDVLDVGQGLAIAVSTAHHTLIYDTGVKFYQGSDMAQLVILPYLENIGINKVDKIVISHPDLDHRGGLSSLQQKFPKAELVVDNVAFYRQGSNCHQYPAWQWDGIHFQFLPIKQAFRDKNNSSCVLTISNQSGSILFTGDIEKYAENYLSATYGQKLAAEVLVVAHHGSKTSSTPAFIHNVAPRYAIISAGFDNRYHFPHAQTITTLQEQGSAIYNTMDCGMVTVRLTRASIEKPKCYKQLRAIKPKLPNYLIKKVY
ncbi:DNA internalization-related competence protein ComEC/Rec2 [Legionella dresdenensis]|uniref:DNA internalization-related competence protein ComEC/Rec2 n=1 Tax=Legionella dresdenensis TaxID=450200 RepID=A0ABV8CGI3_9GAMM